jgi:uncharacterized protein (TIGR02118 family)
MVKQVVLIKKRPEVSFDEFKKHYLEIHAPLFIRLFPECRKYTVNLALQRGKETLYDAISEFWWEDIESIKRAGRSDAYKTKLRPDENEFMESYQIILVEEFPQI